MNIALTTFSYLYWSGGAERYATEVARLLGDLGHTVTIYTAGMRLRPPGPARSEFPCRVVPVETLIAPGTRVGPWHVSKRRLSQLFVHALAGRLVFDHVRGQRHDLIYSQAVSTLAALRARRFTHTPVVCASYNFPWPRFADITADTVARADGLITLNQFTLDGHRAELGERLPPHRVRYIGVNIERFHPAHTDPAVRRELGVSDDAIMILTLQRMDGRKNMEPILAAFQRLTERYPLVRVFVAGAGPRLERYRAWVREHDCADRIQLLGFVDDERLPALYASSDVFIGATFGYVTLEAMASGTATIIMRHQVQAQEYVIDGENGLLVDENTDDVFAALESLVTDPQRREAFADAGRAFVCERFDDRQMARDLIAFFEDVLA